MVKKLIAVWNIVRADKWVVLTWHEDAEMNSPAFRWSMSNYSCRFLKRVHDNVSSLRQQKVKGDGKLFNNGNGYYRLNNKAEQQ